VASAPRSRQHSRKNVRRTTVEEDADGKDHPMRMRGMWLEATPTTRVIDAIRAHMKTDHPALLETVGREDLLGWIQVE